MVDVSVVMPVWNEERFIGHALDSLGEYVDQIVVVDGGPDGPSTDSTRAVVEGRKAKGYPVEFYEGEFGTPDGLWDQASQRNLGLSQCRCQYVLPVDADEVFDETIMMVLELLEEREPLIVYGQLVDFWMDLHHIRPRFTGALMGQPTTANTSFYARHLKLYHSMTEGDGDLGHAVRFDHSLVDRRKVAYVPKYVRWHLGWVRPYEKQIKKHLRNIRRGGWGEFGEKLMERGDRAVVAWALDHVMSYPEHDFYCDFVGKRPWALVDSEYSYLEGADAALKKYAEQYDLELGRVNLQAVYQG